MNILLTNYEREFSSTLLRSSSLSASERGIFGFGKSHRGAALDDSDAATIFSGISSAFSKPVSG